MRCDRLLDANANRAAEGLRVLEEVSRFVFDDGVLSAACKTARHDLRAAVPTAVVAGRDILGDVGASLSAADELCRSDLASLVRANGARAAEALRALEECGKLVGTVGDWEALRYRVYELERALLVRLPAWRLRCERLYALVDPALCADPVATAAALAAGGAGVVQLRAKTLPVRAYRELAGRVQEAVCAASALFVVNDHVAVAAAIGADGIHLGQDDLDPRDARRAVGPTSLIGVSVHTPAQLHAAQAAGADYVGVGPMYATGTKAHEPARGPELLDAIRAELRLPSYAIGGLDGDRLRALAPRLPHGAAVAGALCRAADPRRAAAELREILDGHD
jgi:thiamine-phosphate pyrophosphorylase